MSATISEPLLVTRQQLDDAIRIVESTAVVMAISVRIEARIDVDPEIASMPPVELIVAWVMREPADGHRTVQEFRASVRRDLRAAGLYSPILPLEVFVAPAW